MFASVTRIYTHHILHGLASFEVEPPSEGDMRQRRRDVVGKGFPYLVAEYAGEIVGYAYDLTLPAAAGSPLYR
jgi:L-amino acid N-acyltransferase YncA